MRCGCPESISTSFAKESLLLLLAAVMSFEPAPHAKRQRTTFLDAGKPDLNPAAPVQPDIFSNRRPTHPTPAQSSTSRPRDGQGKKRERSTANGNYLGYYRRRREVQEGDNDERLELIPNDWIKGKRVLDVGANAGEVAIELAQRFKASEVIGVDIDPELTHQARKNGAVLPFEREPLYVT